jgi:hypothetical protein
MIGFVAFSENQRQLGGTIKGCRAEADRLAPWARATQISDALLGRVEEPK